MDQPDHVTKFLEDNFFILQNIFLKIWKIQQKTMKNVSQLLLSENFATNFTLKLSINFRIFFKIFTKKKLTDVPYCLLLHFLNF